MSERRNYVRFVVWFPVTLQTSAGAVGAICRDVGSGGMLLSCGTLLPADSVTTCRFRLSLDSSDELTVRGRVVRSDKNQDDLELVFPFRVAIEFDTARTDIEEMLRHAQDRLRVAP
jgi:hypothetical protein